MKLNFRVTVYIRSSILFLLLLVSTLASSNKQFSEWIITEPHGFSGQVFSSMGEACAAGISKKESDVHNSHPGKYKHRGGQHSGPYFEGGNGNSVYCGHEYKGIKGVLPGSWSTFWPYSGAHVTGRSEGCPAGKVWDASVVGCIYDPSNNGPSCNNTANPINLSTGNKYYSRLDFELQGSYPIKFERFYNSTAGGWRFSFEQSIEFFTRTEATGTHLYTFHEAYYYDSTGKATLLHGDSPFFDIVSGEPGSDYIASRRSDVLSVQHVDEEGIAAKVLKSDGVEEYFDDQFRLVRIEKNNQVVLSIEREGTQVVLSNGQGQLMLITDSKGLPNKLVLPAGDEISYVFESESESSFRRLKSVAYPSLVGEGLYQVNYSYENTLYPNYITKIQDSDGRILSAVSYDTKGRATTSELAEGVNRVEVTYHDPISGENDRVTVRNALGKETTLHFDTTDSYGPRKKVRVEGHQSSNCLAADEFYTYDSRGNVLSKIDWIGNETRYERDTFGNETVRYEAYETSAAREVKTQWFNRRLPSKIINGPATTEFFYDEDELLVKQVLRNSLDTSDVREWSFTYTSNKLLGSIDGPRDDVEDITTFSYDLAGYLSSVIRPLGQVVRYEDYNSSGLPTKITDENGVATYLSYNWLGLVSEVRLELEGRYRITNYRYDNTGLVSSIILPSGDQLTYHYDDAERLIAISNNLEERVEYNLDLVGNRLSHTVKNSTQEIVFLQNAIYDELSRLLSVISPLGDEASYEYDANGQQTKLIDGLGQSWVKSYDALRRLVKETDPELFDVTYTYDALDRITSVTDQRGLITTYTYDAFGNRLTEHSPDKGLTEFGYDKAGNRIYRKDAKGVEVNYSYDALNRLTATTYPASIEESITYNYDQNGECTHGVGRLSGISDAESILQYRYDSRGNLAQKISHIESHSYAISYEYDDSKRLVGLVYPNGREVNYIRDLVGQVQEVRTRENAGGSWVLIASSVTHYPFGAVKSYTYGNGLTQTFEYDQAYRLVSQITPSVLERAYGYDSNQNITSIIDNIDAARTQNFSYDPLNRLGQASGNYGTQGFEYDSVGNRTRWIHSLSPQDKTQNYVYSATSNQLDRVTKTENSVSTHRDLQYDAVGQLIQDARFDGSTFDLKYNDANRLYGVDKNQVATTSYVFNALGQRMAKVSSEPNQDQHYHYDQSGRLIAISDLFAGTMTSYVYLGEHRIAQIKDDVESYDAETCWGDSDRDGLDDQWEMHFFGDLSQDGTGDADGDNFLDIEEFSQGSSPTEITADTDTLPDSWELQYFGSLVYSENGDFDGDGYTNGQEYLGGTDPSNASSPISEDAAYFEEIDSQHMLAFYDMETVAEGVLIDLKGDHDGAVVGAVTSDGVRGASMSFSGNNEYISFGDVFKDLISAQDSKFSFSFWVNPLETNTTQALLNKFSGSENNRSILFSLRENGALRFAYYFNGTSSYRRYIETTETLDWNEWSHVVVTYDGSIDSSDGLDRVHIFVNGQELTISNLRPSGPLKDTIFNSTAPFAFGSSVNSSDSSSSLSYKGRMDTVSIYSNVLEQSDVAVLFNEYQPVTSIELDNTDDSTEMVGDWASGTGIAGFVGGDYASAESGSGAKSFTWLPSLPQSGLYKVYAMWTSSGTRATNAKYVINTVEGEYIVEVNQQEFGGQWSLLGEFSLQPSGAFIRLSDDANGKVIADAVRLEPVGQ